jgi:hypothetical protein
VTPPVSRKCGRPLGSRNKKTLVALATVAGAASAEAVPATAVVVAPAEAAAAAASIGAAPASLIAAAAGGSAGSAAGTARKPRHPRVRQRLSYTSEHGFTTFLAPLRAGCEVCLLLPFRFINMMGGGIR